MKKYRKILISACILLFMVLLFWFFRPQSLAALLGVEEFDTHVEGSLILSSPSHHSDGSISYENTVYDFRAEAYSDAAREVINILNAITIGRRLPLPFEEAPVYDTGSSSLFVSFGANGQWIDLVMLSEHSTIYDIGDRDRSYAIKGDVNDAFQLLCDIIIKYGTPQQ